MVENMEIFFKMWLSFTFSLLLRQVALENLIGTNFLKFPSKFALFVNPFTSMGHQCPANTASHSNSNILRTAENSSIFMPFLETIDHLQSFETKMELIRPKLTEIRPFEIWIFKKNKSNKS